MRGCRLQSWAAQQACREIVHCCGPVPKSQGRQCFVTRACFFDVHPRDGEPSSTQGFAFHAQCSLNLNPAPEPFNMQRLSGSCLLMPYQRFVFGLLFVAAWLELSGPEVCVGLKSVSVCVCVCRGASTTCSMLPIIAWHFLLALGNLEAPRFA